MVDVTEFEKFHLLHAPSVSAASLGCPGGEAPARDGVLRDR